MAIPFKVFDSSKGYHRENRTNYIWCVRCEAWIPMEEAYGAARDPHVSDHVYAWETMRRVERDN